MVDARPAREHVQRLVEGGMRQYVIAEVAGVSGAALSALLHGQFTPGRPPQTTISAAASAQILAVEFEASEPRVTKSAEPRCVPSDQFEAAGYKVGRCVNCGELAPVRTGSVLDGYRKILVGHPTLDPLAGDDL